MQYGYRALCKPGPHYSYNKIERHNFQYFFFKHIFWGFGERNFQCRRIEQWETNPHYGRELKMAHTFFFSMHE